MYLGIRFWYLQIRVLLDWTAGMVGIFLQHFLLLKNSKLNSFIFGISTQQRRRRRRDWTCLESFLSNNHHKSPMFCCVIDVAKAASYHRGLTIGAVEWALTMGTQMAFGGNFSCRLFSDQMNRLFVKYLAIDKSEQLVKSIKVSPK